MFKMFENVVAKEFEERYNSLTLEKQKKLDEMIPSKVQLIKIKRYKEEIKEGDVFVLQPREGIYFFGKVINANIKHLNNDGFINGNNLVYIYKCKSIRINIEDFKPNINELLIKPVIIHESYWRKGLLYTIGNEKVTQEEKDLDYGFYETKNGQFYKENGEKLSKIPRIKILNGITTIIGIGVKIEQELIIDPYILNF